jgi:hypothetical protein
MLGKTFILYRYYLADIQCSGVGSYNGISTLKENIPSWEPAIVHTSEDDPSSCYLRGERESGMMKEPIEIMPADSSTWLRSEPIRFCKTYPIEKNVKLKGIGRVHPDHLDNFLRY